MSRQRLEIRVTDATREAAAEGLRVDLYCLGRRAAKLCSAKVGPQGTLHDPVLASEAIRPGEYEVVFHVAEFYRLSGVAVREPVEFCGGGSEVDFPHGAHAAGGRELYRKAGVADADGNGRSAAHGLPAPGWKKSCSSPSKAASPSSAGAASRCSREHGGAGGACLRL